MKNRIFKNAGIVLEHFENRDLQNKMKLQNRDDGRCNKEQRLKELIKYCIL